MILFLGFVMRSTNDNNDVIGQLLQEVFTDRDSLKRVLEILVNHAMKSESTQYLEAKKYQRTGQRRGYRNGTKPRQLATRVGQLELAVPQTRGC